MFEMRKKLYPGLDTSFNIKKSSGGLADIDFIVSFLLLTNPDLLMERGKKIPASTFEIIKNISVKEINFKQLENNYYLLKQIELTNQLLLNSRISKIPTEELKLKKISNECGFSNTNLFMNRLKEIIEQTRVQFQNIFN
jgi:glutamine synthetase adenylyltransferase